MKQTFTELVETKDPGGAKYGIMPPPMDAQECLDVLMDYLLGEGWYTTLPVGKDQCNTIVTQSILRKYSKEYRKEEPKPAGMGMNLAETLYCWAMAATWVALAAYVAYYYFFAN